MSRPRQRSGHATGCCGSRPNHAGRHGLLAREDAAVGGRAGAVHPPGRRRDDGRGDRRRSSGFSRGRPTTSSTRWSRCGCSSATATAATAATRNTPRPRSFLDQSSPTYIGGILEMANARLYPFWGDLTEALRTGEPQNEIKHTGKPMFEELYGDPERLEQFMQRDGGHLRGQLPRAGREVRLLRLRDGLRRRRRDGPALDRSSPPRHPHLRCTSFDLPAVAPIAERADRRRGARRPRERSASGDFFADPLPAGRRDHDGHDPARLGPASESST